MSLSVEELIHMLGDTQLKYRRLHFADYAKELAPRPVTISSRIQLPSFFRSLFNDGCTLSVLSLSGKKYSFWHCLLYVLYPEYINKTWYERKAIVDKLINELNHDVDKYFDKDDLIKETNMVASDVRFHDIIPSDELFYYIASKFNINLIVCDTTKLHFYFRGLEIDQNQPTLVLYRDDTPIFHVVSVDDVVLMSAGNDHNKTVLEGLHGVVPNVNRVIKEHTTKHKVDVYAKVNKLTPSQQFEMEVTPQLKGLRVGELQIVAQKFGLTIEKKGKTKMIKMTKKELIESILQHNKK